MQLNKTIAVHTLRIIVSAITSGIGVLVPEIWYASILGIALFLYALHSIEGGSWRIKFLAGSAFGSVYVGTVLIWFWHILPLDWVDAGLVGSSLVLGLSWLFVACALGSAFGIFSVAYSTLRTRTFLDILLVGSLWVLCEYFEMWIFAGLTWGVASSHAAHFSATFIGYSLASFSPLLQVATLGGVYTLSFVAAALGISVLYLLDRMRAYRYRTTVVAIGIVLIALITLIDDVFPLVPTKDTEEQSIDIALVSTEFAQHLMRSPESRALKQAAQNKLVQTWAETHAAPDLLVFPEGSVNFPDGKTQIADMTKTFAGKEFTLIDSLVAHTDEGSKQRMLYWSSDGVLRETYDKIFLVPQGEYTPNITFFVLETLGMNGTLEKVRRAASGFVPGNRVPVVDIGVANIGGLFCSDVLSPQLYRSQTQNGAEVLVNAASQVLFHNSPLVDSFVLTVSKVRAVENRRFLVVAGNGVPSSVLSDKGEILARSEKGVFSVLSAEVPLKHTKTLYVRLGEWVLVFPGIALAFFFVRRYVLLAPQKH